MIIRDAQGMFWVEASPRCSYTHHPAVLAAPSHHRSRRRWKSMPIQGQGNYLNVSFSIPPAALPRNGYSILFTGAGITASKQQPFIAAVSVSASSDRAAIPNSSPIDDSLSPDVVPVCSSFTLSSPRLMTKSPAHCKPFQLSLRRYK